ncbi:YbeD family protein [Ostreibacterium oceani]|uniref:UPF0250 protein GCU85_03590 n=1 Tax=Ostreibacterium oceani TaxID=2654998 RepID=A0A6N7ETD8_9GAMM|nr:DUF493 domain-containing protein [Ostreibacterium oceani]MPV85821.1 DUF493 family protein [Ostreibacterium oceani]
MNQPVNQSTSEKPLIEFPTHFPIKAFGEHHDRFKNAVTQIIELHVETIHIIEWREQPSKGGNYCAITITVVAQSQQQLDAIYMDLTDCEHVTMAL